jgi:hypothetical protein
LLLGIVFLALPAVVALPLACVLVGEGADLLSMTKLFFSELDDVIK